MAFRRPLKVDSAGNLRIMNSADLEALRLEAIRQYALAPSIILQFDSDGTAITSIGTITDSRYRSGGTATSASAFVGPAATPDIVNVDVTWDKIAETVAINQLKPVDSADRGYPLYYDGGNLRAMSDSDYIDTFIIPAIDRITSGSLDESDAGGAFHIQTPTSFTGSTRIGNLPVFMDTRADTAAYASAGIPETNDQPVTITNYYLYRVNPPTGRPIPRTAVISSDGNISRENPNQTRKKLGGAIKWATNRLVGYRIRYGLSTGTNMGTGMVNTRLSGPGTYATRLITGDDYRSQEFPAGTPQTISTTFLKIRKT